MDILKAINLGVSFIIELAMLAALAYWGFHLQLPLVGRILVSLAVLALVVVAWGLWLAPKATYPVGLTLSVIMKLFIFSLASWGLYASNKNSLAITLISIFILNEVLALVWHQE